MNDTKQKIRDILIAVSIVFLVAVIAIPFYFPINSSVENADDSTNNQNVQNSENSQDSQDSQNNQSEQNNENSQNEQNGENNQSEQNIGNSQNEQNGENNQNATTELQQNPDINSNTSVDVGFIIILGGIAVVVLSIGYGLLFYIRLSTYKNLAKELIYFKVMPASDYKLPNIAYAKYFLISLSKNLQSPWDPMFLSTPWCRVIYHKKPEDGNIEMILGVPKDRTDGFISAFKAYYPKVQLIEYFELYEDKDGNRYRITSPTELIEDTDYGVSEFKLKFRFGQQGLLPLKMFSKKADEMDPLESIFASMGAGEVETEEVFVDMILKPVWTKFYLYDRGKRYVNKIRGNTTDMEEISSILNSAADEIVKSKGKKVKKRPTMTEYTRASLQKVKQKCSAPERAYATSIRIYIKCQNPEHTIMKLKGVVDGFDLLSDSNELETDSVYSPKKLWDRIYMGYPHPMNHMILSTAELVSFVRVLDSTSPIFLYTDHNDTMAIRAPSGFWEDETMEYTQMD